MCECERERGRKRNQENVKYSTKLGGRYTDAYKVKVKSLSHVPLFVTPWTVAYQATLSMEFSRQEYWSGLPFLSPGDLPNPGIEPSSPALQADVLPPEPQMTIGLLFIRNSRYGQY